MPDSLSCIPDYQNSGFQIPLSKSFPDSGIRITLNGGAKYDAQLRINQWNTFSISMQGTWLVVREFKQIATAGDITAVLAEESLGGCVALARHSKSLSRREMRDITALYYSCEVSNVTRAFDCNVALTI